MDAPKGSIIKIDLKGFNEAAHSQPLLLKDRLSASRRNSWKYSFQQKVLEEVVQEQENGNCLQNDQHTLQSKLEVLI